MNTLEDTMTTPEREILRECVERMRNLIANGDKCSQATWHGVVAATLRDVCDVLAAQFAAAEQAKADEKVAGVDAVEHKVPSAASSSNADSRSQQDTMPATSDALPSDGQWYRWWCDETTGTRWMHKSPTGILFGVRNDGTTQGFTNGWNTNAIEFWHPIPTAVAHAEIRAARAKAGKADLIGPKCCELNSDGRACVAPRGHAGEHEWIVPNDEPAAESQDGSPAQVDGASLIAAERRRQVEQEAFDADHDAEHQGFELSTAAACYAVYGTGMMVRNPAGREAWPWNEEWDKRRKHDRVRRLVIAGALIAAEIDRVSGFCANAKRPATVAGERRDWWLNNGHIYLNRNDRLLDGTAWMLEWVHVTEIRDGERIVSEKWLIDKLAKAGDENHQDLLDEIKAGNDLIAALRQQLAECQQQLAAAEDRAAECAEAATIMQDLSDFGLTIVNGTRLTRWLKDYNARLGAKGGV